MGRAGRTARTPRLPAADADREERLQLQILAALAQAMIAPEARERLSRAQTRQAVWLALDEALRARESVRVSSRN